MLHQKLPTVLILLLLAGCAGATNAPTTSADYLRVSVVGATTTTVFEELGSGDYGEAVWASFNTSLDAYAGQIIYLLVEAADGGGGSLVEAAIDDVSITQ